MIENEPIAQFKQRQLTMLRKPVKKRVASAGEETMALDLKSYNIPFEREKRFCSRLWRLDFILTGTNYAVEIEGGLWNNGRHVRPQAMEEDMRKYNAVAMRGIRLLRFSTSMVINGEAITGILQALKP